MVDLVSLQTKGKETSSVCNVRKTFSAIMHNLFFKVTPN